jgi:hypothetical protein
VEGLDSGDVDWSKSLSTSGDFCPSNEELNCNDNFGAIIVAGLRLLRGTYETSILFKRNFTPYKCLSISNSIVIKSKETGAGIVSPL